MNRISDDLLRHFLRRRQRDLVKYSMLCRRIRSACKRVVVAVTLFSGDGRFAEPFEFTALRSIQVRCSLEDGHCRLLQAATADCYELRSVAIFQPGPVLPTDLAKARAAVGTWPHGLTLLAAAQFVSGVSLVTQEGQQVTHVRAQRVRAWDPDVPEVLEACTDAIILYLEYHDHNPPARQPPMLLDFRRLQHMDIRRNTSSGLVIPRSVCGVHVDGMIPDGLVVPPSVTWLELESFSSKQPAVVIQSLLLRNLRLRDVHVDGGLEAWIFRSRCLQNLEYSSIWGPVIEIARAAALKGVLRVVLFESRWGGCPVLARTQIRLFEVGEIRDVWGTGMTASLADRRVYDGCSVCLLRPSHESAIT